MNKWFITLIVLAVAFEVTADILFKYWTLNARNIFLWGGVILYSVGTVIWAYSLKFEYLSKAITVFTIFNLIAVVLAGLFIFDEHLSLINKIGILLGIVSVVLIQL